MRSRLCARRKGVSGFVATVGLIVLVLFTISASKGLIEWGVGQSINMWNEYQVARLDGIVQSDIKQVFSEPALLWTAMATAVDLASHGGIDATTASTLNLRTDSSNVVYWLDRENCYLSTSSPCVNTNKIPFLYWQDANEKIGLTPFPITIRNSGDAEIPAEISMHVMILKTGTTVTLSCVDTTQPSCKLDGAATKTITTEGLHKITISGVSSGAVTLKITASQNNGALIGSVIVSSFAGGSEIPSNMAASYFNAYKTELLAKSLPIYTNLDVELNLPDYKTTFASTSDGFTSTAAWPSTGYISASYKTLETVYGNGYADRTTKIRYWKLYEVAKGIAEQAASQNLLQNIENKFHEEMDAATDKITDRTTGCNSCENRDCTTILNDLGAASKTKLGTMATEVNTKISTFTASADVTNIINAAKADSITVTLSPTITSPTGYSNLWKAKQTINIGPTVNTDQWNTGVKCDCSGVCDSNTPCASDYSGTGNKPGGDYKRCETVCEYSWGVDYKLALTVSDPTYYVYKDGQWQTLAFTVNVGGLDTDEKIIHPIEDSWDATPAPTCKGCVSKQTCYLYRCNCEVYCNDECEVSCWAEFYTTDQRCTSCPDYPDCD